MKISDFTNKPKVTSDELASVLEYNRNMLDSIIVDRDHWRDRALKAEKDLVDAENQLIKFALKK